MGAADWYWKYTGSDLADWFDAEDEKYWKQHDEFLIQSQMLGDAHPVFVFAGWFNDRLTTLPSRLGSVAASGIVDVLRLGNDFDPDAGWWGTTKGVVLNLLRVVTVVQPLAGEYIAGTGVAMRGAGIRATAALDGIAGAKGPCAYVNINNILSYLSGKTVQLFASVEDIIVVRGKNLGAAPGALLDTDVVKAALTEFGITTREVGGLNNVDEVLRAAARSDGPIAFSIKWINARGEVAFHRLVAMKDAAGSVRILDYVPKIKTGVFNGYESLQAMGQARPGWGTGFAQVELNLERPIIEFLSTKLKLLRFADDSFSVGIALALGVQWTRGHSIEDKLKELSVSAFEFKKARQPFDAPPPPKPSVVPQLPDSPVVPQAPDATRKRLGNTPLAPEAAKAPRISWLTGVQYRLKYLNYYRGAVHGQNDGPTKAAVLAFQKSWFETKADWDAIPGPRTQAALYSAIGW